MAYKILMVDDEPDLDILIQQRFRKQIAAGRYVFFFARHGAAALEILRAHPQTALVLTDLNMPEMNGIELLTHIKDLYQSTKTVILSAYGDSDNRARALAAGAQDYLTKPIVFKDLEMIIQTLLEEPSCPPTPQNNLGTPA